MVLLRAPPVPSNAEEIEREVHSEGACGGVSEDDKPVGEVAEVCISHLFILHLLSIQILWAKQVNKIWASR